MDIIYLLILIVSVGTSIGLGAKLIEANSTIKGLNAYAAYVDKMVDEMTIDEQGFRVGDALSWRRAAREAQDIAAERAKELAHLQTLIESHLNDCDSGIDLPLANALTGDGQG